jgi:hypothetical protein
MTMKQLAILLSAALATPSASTIGMAAFEYHPPEGFVPDAETASKISEVILFRMFGETQTNLQKPLQASLEGGVWTVKGTMPPNMLGGVAELRISKKDAQILYFAHGM